GMGQAENTASTEGTNVDESGVVSEDTEVQTGNAVDEVTEGAKIPSTAFDVELDDIAKLIEQSQDGVKKGLRMLLKAVVKAICGNNDGRERKTDLFSVLGGNSMGSFDDSDSDMLFIGAEIMSRISIAAEFGLEQEDTNADDIIMGLDKLVKKIFSDSEDDDEIDESTAAEIVSALLNIPVHDDVTFAPEAEKVEAVENAVTVLKAPKEELREVQPEKIPEAEHKVDEFKAEIKSVKYEPKAKPEVSIQDTVNDARSFMQMNSAAARINDAGAQIRALSGETADEEVVAGLAEEKPADVDAESVSIAAAVNAEPHVVRIENSPEIKIEAEDDLTARSVE
ncbi:MAG: hypothetical protein K2H23_05570, partial [Oscillospiraceae bacterium]|nr:hypothetical protein [Oscillospiraceae bacterium]